jgi:phage FluMu protein gp41
VLRSDQQVPGLGNDAEQVPAAPPAPAPEPARFQTEFAFTLPRGYVDGDGVVHREGRMRLATARDELLPLSDDRVRTNPPYLTVMLLSRVVTKLGTIEGNAVSPQVIENLFAADLAFLQELYRRINAEGSTQAVVTCPSCNEQISVDLAGGRLGES